MVHDSPIPQEQASWLLKTGLRGAPVLRYQCGHPYGFATLKEPPYLRKQTPDRIWVARWGAGWAATQKGGASPNIILRGNLVWRFVAVTDPVEIEPQIKMSQKINKYIYAFTNQKTTCINVHLYTSTC